MPRENKSIVKTKQTVTMTSMSSAVAFTKKEIPAPKVSQIVKEKEISKVESVPEKLPSAKDILRLRYMRFKSVDIESTIDFYTTIGMNVDFKSNQELWVNQNTIKKRNTTNQVQGKSKAVDNKVIPQAIKKAVVGLSFKVPGSATLDPNDNIQILFEKDDIPSIVNSKPINDQAINDKDVKTLMVQDSEEGKEPHSYEYLVIYVHFLDRLVKRLVAKGFKSKVFNSDLSDIKMAIFTDPNGLEVRIMELPKEYLGEDDSSTKKTWFARLAYYTVPTTRIEDSVDFYEDTLSVFKKKQEVDEMQAILGISVAKLKKKNSARLLDSGQTKVNFHQFRLIDAEEFVIGNHDLLNIGLTQTKFYWMANDSRASACSVCFTEKSDVDSKFDSRQQTKAQNLNLLSIGFHVSNLDSSITRIKNETKGLVWEDNRYLITKIGIISKFLDKINNVWIELFTGKIPDPPKVKERGRNLINDETFYSKKESTCSFYIHKNHLKGHARTLSEGAVLRIRTFMDEDEYSSPSKSTNSKPIIKSPSCIF